MVVHCSNKLNFFSYSTTIAACFLVLVVQYGFFSTTNTNTLEKLVSHSRFWKKKKI